MLKNRFLILLFDWRGTITRREYWACLIFLFFLLISSNIWYIWNQLTQTFGSNSYSMQADMRAIQYMQYIFSGLTSILYFASIAVSVSLLIVTIKRAATMGFSKTQSWVFAIFTYLLYFSANAMYAGYRYLESMKSAGIYNDSTNDSSIITYINIGLGILMLGGLVSIIILSRWTDRDYNDDFDDKGYNTVSCIFGLAKYSIAYTITIFLWRWVASGIEKQSLSMFLLSAIALGFLIAYICILVWRSRDAGVSVGYFIGAMILVSSITVYYFYKSHDGGLYDRPLFRLFLDRLCYLSIYLYWIYTFILIILPTRKRIMGDEENEVTEKLKAQSSE